MSRQASRSDFLRRVAVTAVGMAVLLAANRPLPLGIPSTNSTTLFLGLGPFATSTLIVWLVLQLFPRHRGRDVTRDPATIALTVVLTLVEATTTATRLANAFPSASAWHLAVELSGGSLLCVGLAALLRRYGCGNGVSVVVATIAAADLSTSWPQLASHLRGYASTSEELTRSVTCFVALLLLVIFSTRRSLSQPHPRSLRLPICGLLPLFATSRIMVEIAMRWPGATFDQVAHAHFVQTFVLISLCVLCATLEYRPRWLGLSSLSPKAAVSTRQLVVGLARSVAFVSILFLLAPHFWVVNIFDVVVLVAVVLDLRAEWKLRRSHAEVATIGVYHHVVDADLDTAALTAAGVPAVARAVHHRALWLFYAPHLPIELLVPAEQAELARKVLGEPKESPQSARVVTSMR